MNFNAPLLRPLRILLFPFSLVYGLVVWVRNIFFDKGWIGSSSFNLPLIGVGNLSAGGTGKSPMVEFIVSRLKEKHKIAVLSRGYKRKTAGFAVAEPGSTALEIGDEPLLLYQKHPDIIVAVGEERIVAIPQLLQEHPDTETIVLDDAFQHRYVKPGLDILLTDYNNLFTRDWFLPTGDLRDVPSGYKRAHIIVVTKCPPNLLQKDREKIISEIKPLKHQHVFFTSIEYGTPYHLVSNEQKSIDDQTEVLLISGIANPKPLKRYLYNNAAAYYEILYSDHHIFTIDDLNDIKKRFDGLAAKNKIILTTEKDAMRLIKFSAPFTNYPVYVIPIAINFLFGEESAFTGLIVNFIASYKKEKQSI